MRARCREVGCVPHPHRLVTDDHENMTLDKLREQHPTRFRLLKNNIRCSAPTTDPGMCAV